MFHHATSVSTGLYKSFEVSKSEYDFLVSKSNKKEIDQRISDFRKAHQGEYNSEAIMDFHWKLAEASRDLFGIYLIKRKYFVSWRKANEIFQRRIKRYGKAKVDGILNALWAEKDKENSNYPTRPDILRKSSKNLRNFLNENEDCSAKQLGENTIWYDLMDLATSEMNRVETKKEYIKNILNGDSNIYNNLVADFLEETYLLAAYYITTAYGKSLYKSDMGYEIQEEERLRRFNSTEYLNILSGFSIAYKHCKTIGFLKSLEIGRESEMLTAKSISEMKRSIQNADCNNLIRVAAFDDAKVELLDLCGVRHSQSFSYRKICAVYWAYDTQEESVSSEEQDHTLYEKVSKFENHKLYKISDGAMIPPPVLGCDNFRFDGLVCYLKALEMDISYSFKEELKARGVVDISRYTELAGGFNIEPDGSYTPSYITSKEKVLVEAFEAALKKSTKFGAFKLNDNTTAVRTGHAYFLLQKNSK